MNLTIIPSSLEGTVRVPSSKSEAHRLLICAALSALYNNIEDPEKIYIECTDTNDDINATARCLNGIGANIERTDCGFFVNPITHKSIKNIDENIVIDCGESGSTLRFLLPVIAALGISVKILMHGRLPERPLSPLYEELVSHGAQISPQGENPLTVGGNLTGGEYSIRGDVSSQFISGLLFALPLLGEDSVLTVTGKIESEPYIHMTLDALRRFTDQIAGTLPRFNINHNTKSNSISKELCACGDWSGAAFWLAAGVVGRSPLTVTGLNLNTRQGDSAIVSVLEKLGGHFSYEDSRIVAHPSKLVGTEIDASQIPDLVPILATVASVAKGRTVITGAARLRIKESDRLLAVRKMLCSLGASVIETDEGLIIDGVDTLTGGEVNAYGDHRIAMSAGIAATLCASAVTVVGAESIAKSYPAFWKDYSALGGSFLNE